MFCFLQSQEDRLEQAPEVHAQVEAFVQRLRSLLEPSGMPYTLLLDDPSGNSFLENPFAPKVRAADVRLGCACCGLMCCAVQLDPALKTVQYFRTEEQNRALGNFAGNAAEGAVARAGVCVCVCAVCVRLCVHAPGFVLVLYLFYPVCG